MPITLDPAKQFVEIKLFYVEMPSKHGDFIYKFINNKEEMEEWREKGYKHEQEVKNSTPIKNDGKIAGMPIEPTHDPNKIIYSITTKWKRILWKDQNTILSKCIRPVQGQDGVSRTDFDTIAYRDMKLKQCLKEWDLKDERGNPVKVSMEAIDSLTPDVANELISAFEKYTEASSSDLGESNG